MLNIERLSKELSELTILEAAELVKQLEKKWGVKANSIVEQQNTSSNKQEKDEAKKEFDVILKSVGDKKIQVIKAVRDITSLGLKEAKGLVDQAPKSIKAGISKEEAEKIKEQFEKHGATIEIK